MVVPSLGHLMVERDAETAGPAACTALAFCLTFAPSPEAPDAPVLEPFGDSEGLALYLNPPYLGVIFLRV